MADVLHVEDYADYREVLQERVELMHLSYCGVATLFEFVQELNKCLARVYVVDGRFPVRARARAEFLAHRACDEVRKRDQNERIILWSMDDRVVQLAAELRVYGVYKGEGVEPVMQIVERLVREPTL